MIRALLIALVLQGVLWARERRGRALSEHTSDLVALCDAGGRIRAVSSSCRTVLGYAPAELKGRAALDLVHTDDRGRVREILHAHGSQPAMAGRVEVRLQGAAGCWRTVELSTHRRLHDPALRGIIVTGRDITERKQAEEALRQNEERQERQARHAALRADIGVALGESTTIRDMLQRCCAALVQHLDVAFVRVWTLDEAAAVLELQASAGLYSHIDGAHARVPVGHLKIGRIAQEGRPHLTNEVLADPRVGDKAWARREGMVAFAGYPLLSDERVTGVLALFARHPLPEDTLEALAATVEIIVQGLERKRVEEALRHQALHDALTGLPNRVFLQDHVQQAILAAQQDHQPLGLLLLDLDRFKEVNDTLGHQHGDLLLQQVAERLRATLRATDTVARLGGDEFAVLLPATDRTGATSAAGKVHAALDSPFVVDGQSLRIGTSLGLALCPEHGRDPQVLLRHADVAMYAAKRSGDACATYTPEQDDYTADRLTLRADLHQAITQGDLLLHYQPKVHLPTGQVRGVEALVRWTHPQRGLVPPGEFIPLAEQTGLIGPLTHWVLGAALQQCHAWRRAGLQLYVAVNISLANVRDPHLPDIIAQLLTTYDVPPAALRLEVTESTLMADVARAQEVLRRLAALDVGISVDDFGTGYSSLAHLKRLPVDELKIDMSFVRHMAEDATDRAIVASTVALGHSLGLQVVAEGVEDRHTQQMLAGIGCDAAQGYYLSRPLPADAVAPWLRETQPAAA
jgi:diguanylate cyclase (GGDEF)-like protein/PAS domain S-box-containing protein